MKDDAIPVWIWVAILALLLSVAIPVAQHAAMQRVYGVLAGLR